jgi:hypothetical protein
MGASLAGFIGLFPWITMVSEYKEIVFAMAGIMLSLSAWIQWRGRYAPCPADPAKARACMRLRKVSLGILIVSILIYFVGVFFAFFASNIFF